MLRKAWRRREEKQLLLRVDSMTARTSDHSAQLERVIEEANALLLKVAVEAGAFCE